MNRNTTTLLMKECITRSLLLLLEEKPLESISILEIVEKAGVNRSTYYRHFQTKLDILRYFYKSRLDECLSALPGESDLEQYFYRIFTGFLQSRKELLLLDARAMSHLLLEEMNSRFAHTQADPVQLMYCRYHIGGVFNCFCSWVGNGMTMPPDVLAKRCVEILPEDFYPRLRMGQ